MKWCWLFCSSLLLIPLEIVAQKRVFLKPEEPGEVRALRWKDYKIVESLWLHFTIKAEIASKIWNFILLSVPKSWWSRCKEVWCAHPSQDWSPASQTTSTSPAPAASRAPRPPSAWPGGRTKNIDCFTILGFRFAHRLDPSIFSRRLVRKQFFCWCFIP